MTNIKVSAIEGNGQKLDGGAMFGNAPRPMWEKWIAPDALGRIPLSCRCFLIEWDEQKLLLETGVGAFFAPDLAERYGIQDSDRHLLRENLAALGVHEDQITAVVLSHLHFDHAGGLLPSYQELQDGKQELLFPKAKYYVSRQALERADHPHPRDRASFLPDLQAKLHQSGRLEVLEGNEKLFGGRLEFRLSHGHTPGQLLSLVHGEHASMIFCGDLVPGCAWVHVPITMGYDRYAELVIDEKRELYEGIEHANTWLCFTHDIEFCAAKIELDSRSRYQAVEMQKQWQRFVL